MIEQRLMGELGSVHGLSLTDALLLMHLERSPLNRLTRVDLAKRLHLNPSTVTRMAAPLEKIGLVRKEADQRDARLSYVALTDRGQHVVKEVRATLNERSDDFFRDRWTDDEISLLNKLLRRLTVYEAGDIV